MGDQHQSRGKFAVKIKQQFDDPLSRRGIQIARRLIREQNLGLGRECPSNGNPLLLSTTQFDTSFSYQSIISFGPILNELNSIQHVFFDGQSKQSLTITNVTAQPLQVQIFQCGRER